MTTPFLYTPTFAPVFNGGSVPNGLLYTYEAGTTNPKPTFADAAGLFPNANPVLLDITGAATVRLEPGAYHFVLRDAANSQTIWDQDFYTAPYLTSADVGALLYPQTQAEINAGVVPLSFLSKLNAIDPMRYGAKGDGINDDTIALQSWLLVLGQNTQTAYGLLPSGTYRYTANLTVPANVYLVGAGSQTTILKPDLGVSVALTTASGVKLQSFQIDGSKTSKATGLLIGPVGPDYNDVRDVWVQNFAGASNGTAGYGTGIQVQNVVSLFCLRMFAVGCNNGMVVQSPTPASLPTTCTFQSCRFRTSVYVSSSLSQTGDGVRVLSGQQITFRDCIFEVNGARGLFAQATLTGGTGIVMDLSVQDSWFEDNWSGHVDTGTNVYSIHIDGATAAGVNVALSNVRLIQGSSLSDRKSILLSSCLATLEKIRCFYGFAHDIVVNGATALVYVKDDAYDRCGRFIDNPSNIATVVYPPYQPVINLGTGFSVLPTIEKLVGLTYTASMTPDLKDGNSFNIQVSNTSAMTINNPLNYAGVQVGKRMSIRLVNVSGNNVMGAVSWGPLYKVTALTQITGGLTLPQNNFSMTIEFEWDGAHMVECYHSPLQVPV